MSMVWAEIIGIWGFAWLMILIDHPRWVRKK